MKEVIIKQISFSWKMPEPTIVITLKEKGSDSSIDIFVRSTAGQALIRALNKYKVSRPTTYDLIATLLKDLKGTLKHVVLTEYKEEDQTFYAAIFIESNGTDYEIDTRPSDALVLATIAKVPIFAKESLLEWAGEQDISKYGPLSILWPIPDKGSI